MSENLDNAWVDFDSRIPQESGFYMDSEGVLRLAGKNYRFRVNEYTDDSPEADAFPTRQRVDVVLGPNLDGTPDATTIVLPGFGESTALFAGSFLEVLAQAVREQGLRNPRIVLANTGGRGTNEYAEKGEGSKTRLKAALSEGGRLAQHLNKEGHLGGPVTVIGHSMGSMVGWKLVEGLWQIQEREQNTGFSVKQHTGLMPAVLKPFAGLDKDFLLAVRELVPQTLLKYITAEGLALTPEQYKTLMLKGANDDDQENYKKTFPDSARVFMDWVLNRDDQNIPVPPNGSDFRANIFWADREALLPQDMGIEQHRALARMGISTTSVRLEPFAHSIPFHMTGVQRAELIIKAARTGMLI